MSKILDGLIQKAEGEVSSVASIAMPWWLKLIPYVLVLAAVGAALYFTYGFGVDTEHKARLAEVATLNQAHTLQIAAIDRTNRDALEKAQTDVREKEQKAAADMAALDAKHFKELSDANSKADAAVAAVRAGTVRVRQRFTCPTVRSDASTSGGAAQVAATASVGDGTGERGLSGDDIQVLLRIGERANGVREKLTACQAIIMGYGGQP